mgnify:CR=1 FL=1
MNVWVNGCFDILHIGHIRMLKYAKSMGDRLIVGIDTDERVSKAKGPSRPYNNVQDRIEMLRSMWFIDEIVIFDTNEELCDYIEQFQINTMVVGSDWKGKKIIGGSLVPHIKYFDRIN